MTTCKRPDCDNELHTGKGYCSNKCAAMDRKRVKLEKEQAVALAVIPNHMVERLEAVVGKDQAQLVALEVNKFLAEERISIPIPLVGNTYSDLVLSYDGTKDYRPGSQLSFDIIDKMLRSGPVVFAMEMKRAQVFRVFSQGRFKVISPDTELAEVAEAALRLILPKMAQDLTWSAFVYGVSFQEEIWERRTKYQLGMVDQKDKVEFVVPKVPKSVKPSTIDHIRRTPDGSFNGFAQRGKTAILNNLIEVDATQALVVPLNERFGNLWGESILKAVYIDWLWYEIIFRTMARYMERMASPTAIAEAPSRATVTVSGSSAPVKAMDLALALAGSLQKSNAVAIPSDTDENNNKLWSIKYLEAGERAQPFLTVLEFLAQAMIRDALSADRSLSQSSGGVGSYNIGEVHAAASAVTSEMILLQFLHYINSYFMPDFSLYNRGQDGPPIWLRTQAIDTQERQLLMQLISVAGNSPAAQELFYMIDWRTLLDTSNIPPLAEDKVDELKKKLDDQQAEKMERQQEIMAKNQVPAPTGGASMFKKPNEGKKTEPSNGNTKTEIELEAEAWGNVLTNRVPWMLGEHEARILYEAGVIDDQVVRLFNPFHDELGRFAPKQGSPIGEFVGGKVTSRTIGKFTSGDPAALDYIKKNDFLSDRGLWGRTGEGERLQAMQGLVDNVTKAHQTTPIEVKYMPRLVEFANPHVLGYFDGKSLNLSRHYTRNQTIGVNVAMHEYRHHYQWEAATGKIKHDPQEAAVWRDNFMNYKTPERHGFRAYYNQPIEVDARDYSNSITYAAYGEIVLEDSNIQLFNPNHDNLGRFAPKSGSGVINRAKDWAAAHKKEIAIGVGIGVVGGAAALYFATRKDPSAWPAPDKIALKHIKASPLSSENSWSVLSVDDKLSEIRKIADKICDDYKMDKAWINTSRLMPDGTFGKFNKDRSSIDLNEDILQGGSAKRVTGTIAHELRHHYQWQAYLGIVKHNKKQSSEWGDNFHHYLDSETYGFKNYFDQPIEREAFDYANAIVRAIFGGTNAS